LEKNIYRVPQSLFLIIAVILFSMYYYAAYVDIPSPEDTVTEFYEAYFNKDFSLAADHVSVFWAAQLLPQYFELKPHELLTNRDTIEDEVANFFTTAEEGSEIPANLTVDIRTEYTRIGESAALVVYDLAQNGETMGMEMAMLIKETDHFYIINLYPMQEENLNDVKEFDIQKLDTSFQELLK